VPAFAIGVRVGRIARSRDAMNHGWPLPHRPSSLMPWKRHLRARPPLPGTHADLFDRAKNA